MMLCKMIGALLLPLGGWLAGDAVQQRSREHCEALIWAIELLQRIRQEIEFRRADLNLLYSQLLHEGILEESGECKCLQQVSAPHSLSPAERRCFEECISRLGRTDAAQECEQLCYYIARFQEYLARARQNETAQAGLSHRLGFAAGAILALVML